MIDRNEALALAEEFRKFDRLGVRVPMDSCAQMIEALAAKAEPQGGEVDPLPRHVREAMQRMVEDSFLRGPASKEDGLVVAQWMRHPAPKPAEGEGWVLVPVEPTPEMVEAACIAGCEEGFIGWHGKTSRAMQEVLRKLNRDAWAAMLAAAPKKGEGNG